MNQVHFSFRRRFNKTCRTAFQAEGFRIRNGPSTTFALFDLPNSAPVQVDIIHIEEQHWDMAKFFYSFGDVGHLIGLMLKRAGLKMSSAGFYKVIQVR